MARTKRLIASQTLGSDTASVTFSSLPQTYDDLVLVVSARANINYVDIEFNNNASNYSGRFLYGSGSSAGSGTQAKFLGVVSRETNTANTFGSLELYVPNYAGSTNKSFSATSAFETNATGAEIHAVAGLWADTSAITQIKVYPENAADFLTGSSFYLYGISHS